VFSVLNILTYNVSTLLAAYLAMMLVHQTTYHPMLR